ncbi:hypothetical protein Ddye_029036 [Dipteronia dyeriana]|uniref:H15 domain-containing protein n=1 Tax=Dipteronia dyeriana TaxID=168575 RepID=A0AAD9WK82_9ROSI|nr:hypothetical protein Ddye_029036 [Dipteronia dyeriana]
MLDQHQKFEIVMRQLESLKPSLGFHKKEIEKRFAKITHTPNHPPYASMILKAISESDEQGGSSEEAISTFIEAEYDDLPIPHTSLLSHHLQKLITKGEIVCTSANCYTLSVEISDSVHKSKKGQKPSRKIRQGGLKGRQRNAKEGAQSQQKPRIEESQEHNLVCEKISEGADKQKQAEDEVIERELQEDVVTEEPHHREQKGGKPEENNQIQDHESEAREEQVQFADIQVEKTVEQINPQGQCQVTLWQTVEGTAEEHNQEEESHQAIKNNEVTQTELQEVRDDVVTEEPHGEELINSQGQCFEMSFEEKQLQEQQREVCCQIIDLSNMLVQFIKEKENEATVSHQNGTTIQKEDFSGSSHLTKEGFMELLKKTNKIEGKLIDIISSKNMDMLKRNNSEPTAEMQQKKLLEDHLQQTKKPSESLLVFDCQPQQQEICGQLEVSESQPKTILASDTGLIHKRPPEVGITILEGLNREQNKQVKLCDQPEAFKLQTKSIASSLDAASNSQHNKNENENSTERVKMVLEENGDSPTPEPIADVQFIDSEKLHNSKHCGPEKLPESQLVACSLSAAMELSEEDELTTSDTCLNLDLQFPVVPNRPPELTVQVEELSTDGQQQTTFSDVAKRPEDELGQEQQPENLYVERPTEHELMEVEQQMHGQKLVDQLPPLSQMPSKPQLTTTTTCITKQHGKTKKIPDQLQLRKLRPRGPMCSKHEPVVTSVEADKGPRQSKHEPVTTFEADNDHVTLASLKAELKQNSELSIRRRPQERESQQAEVEISQSTEKEPSIRKRKQKIDSHKALVKISQSTEQQGQRKQLKSQPTVVTTVDSGISSQQQSEQVYPQSKRRGRPPKVKPDADSWPKKKGSLFSDNHNDEEQQQKRPRGRPPKSKLSSKVDSTSSPNILK